MKKLLHTIFYTMNFYTCNCFPAEIHFFQVHQTFQCRSMEVESSILLKAQILVDILNLIHLKVVDISVPSYTGVT